MSGGPVDPGHVHVTANDVFTSNGPLKIVSSFAATVTPVFPSLTITPGNYVLICAGHASGEIADVLVNGVARPPLLSSTHSGDGIVSYFLFRWLTGDANIQVDFTSGGAFALFGMELSGLQASPPFTRSDLDSVASPGDPVTTPSFDPTSTGLAFAVAVSQSPTGIVGFDGFHPPPSWVELIRFVVGSFTTTIFVTGVSPEHFGPEPLSPPVVNAAGFTSSVLPLYDLGLQIRPAVAVTSAPGGQLLAPGYQEPPPVIEPFEPPVNPLPPDGGPVKVPLPPYTPRTGPFRRST